MQSRPRGLHRNRASTNLGMRKAIANSVPYWQRENSKVSIDNSESDSMSLPTDDVYPDTLSSMSDQTASRKLTTTPISRSNSSSSEQHTALLTRTSTRHKLREDDTQHSVVHPNLSSITMVTDSTQLHSMNITNNTQNLTIPIIESSIIHPARPVTEGHTRLMQHHSTPNDSSNILTQTPKLRFNVTGHSDYCYTKGSQLEVATAYSEAFCECESGLRCGCQSTIMYGTL